MRSYRYHTLEEQTWLDRRGYDGVAAHQEPIADLTRTQVDHCWTHYRPGVPGKPVKIQKGYQELHRYVIPSNSSRGTRLQHAADAEQQHSSREHRS
jgi:hypothetical protein